MKIMERLEKSKQFWFVIFTTFFFFILRLPSLFEPLWYGDEGVYQVVGTALNHGKLLYKDVFDNKPPLLYWLYAFLHSAQFSVRFVSLIFGALSVVVFYLLSKKLFKSNSISYLTTFIFTLLFGLPVLEGNIANAENFMLLPIIVSALLIVNQKKYFIAGLLLGLAFLFKIVAVFDLSAFVVFYFILNIDSFKKEVKLTSVIVGFLLPFLFVSIYFLSNGTFMDFIKAAFISNVSYVSYGNRIGSLPVLLFIKLILLGAFLIFILTKRKKIDRSNLFVLIWFAFSLFNAFFSQRPYTHYLLTLLPSFCLMIGLILFEKKYRKIIIITFLLVLVVVAKGFGVPKFNRNVNYYQNFISYVAGKETMAQYQGFFDARTPYDYEIARFIRPRLGKNDTVFIWGDNAQLYQIIGTVAPTKYVVSYHITGYEDGFTTTQKALDKTKPEFIIVMQNSSPFAFDLTDYSLKISINNAAIYERII
jgi:4-amino-4-deoxy-L-arabinose transferase-like glycosyltransferase